MRRYISAHRGGCEKTERKRKRRRLAGRVSIEPERAVSLTERKTERGSVRTNDRTAAAAA